MNFTDPRFPLFIAVVFILYYLPALRAGQIWVLVLASLGFYAWNQPWLLGLLAASVLISTLVSYRILGPDRAGRRSWWLTGGVVANLVLLGFFKYKGFVYHSLFGAAVPAAWAQMILDVPLPIGISFYSFHGISLLVDAARREDLRRSLKGSLAQHGLHTVLYLTFFPQLISGPIIKAHDFYPQIGGRGLADIGWNKVVKSLILGYFLKCVVADNLQDQTFWLVFPYFQNLSSATMLVLLLGYSIQIFADFAGYSLIAIGLAGLFGYRLPANFNFPYLSQSFSEFWTRWHMSLSAWLREYLYFTLGGNRLGAVRTGVNLMLVMLLGGLWHGAAWSFVLWGGWHGLLLVIERPFLVTAFYQSRHWLVQTLRTLWVFAAVSLGWLLFKLPHIADVGQFFHSLAANRGVPLNPTLVLGVLVYAWPVVGLHLLTLCRDWWHDRWLEDLGYGLMLVLILLNSGNANAFIYFQF